MCCCFYYYVRKSVLFKIYAANIEALNFWGFFFVGDGKLFLKFFQMLVGRAKRGGVQSRFRVIYI